MCMGVCEWVGVVISLMNDARECVGVVCVVGLVAVWVAGWVVCWVDD